LREETLAARSGKGAAGEVRATAAAAVARTDRSLSLHRSPNSDELRLALSRRARRRANRYAKEAAIALLRQLDDTDFAGVIAFDSQPYVLAHLQQLGDDRGELENRIDRLQPAAGTDFKDALEIAEREILQSNIPVRQVILLTEATPTANITTTTI